MNDLITAISPFVSIKYLPLLTLLPFVGRGYDSIRNGGGLKGFWRAIWLGRSTPEQSKSPETK